MFRVFLLGLATVLALPSEGEKTSVRTRTDLFKFVPLKCNSEDEDMKLSCESHQARWQKGMNKALDLLPLKFFEDLPSRLKPIIFSFDISDDPQFEATTLGSHVSFKISSDWKFLAYTEDDFVAMTVHEIGHIYPLDCNSFLANVNDESVPTTYATQGWIRTGTCDEDFAESFMLYVYAPKYLQMYFPERYKIVQRILKREYPNPPVSSEFIRQRITKPLESDEETDKPNQ